MNVYTYRCATCENAGRSGYCAPRACYCGHPACTAYASWVPLADRVAAPTRTIKSRAAASWADREEPTWLDR